MFTVEIDGKIEEFRNRSQAIARGDYSGKPFVVRSPRGVEVHTSEGKKTAPTVVASEKSVVFSTPEAAQAYLDWRNKQTADLPSKKYACVLADGTVHETGRRNLARTIGENSFQDFVILSPRGYITYEGRGKKEIPEPPTAVEPVARIEKAEPTPDPTESVTVATGSVLAEKIEVGQTVHGTTKRNPVRTVGKVVVGRRHVTTWDEIGKVFGYWPVGSDVALG